jgi:hypothetical protein
MVSMDVKTDSGDVNVDTMAGKPPMATGAFRNARESA